MFEEVSSRKRNKSRVAPFSHLDARGATLLEMSNDDERKVESGGSRTADVKSSYPHSPVGSHFIPYNNNASNDFKYISYIVR